MKLRSVYVRARTADGRWATVDVLDLDEKSWRAFASDALARTHLVASLERMDDMELTTPLTLQEADNVLRHDDR